MVRKHINFQSLDILTKKENLESEPFPLHYAICLVVIADTMLMVGSGFLIYRYHVGWEGAVDWLYVSAILIPSMSLIFIFNVSGLYSCDSICSPLRRFKNLIGILTITFLAFLALAFSFKISQSFSRVWVFSWFLSAVALICVERIIFSKLFIKWAGSKRISRKIVIVGDGYQAKCFIESLKVARKPWLVVVGIFDDRVGRIGQLLHDLPLLGNVKDLLAYCRENKIDDIVITLPWNAKNRLNEILITLEELPISIHIVSNLSGILRQNTKVSLVGDTLMLNIAKKPLEGWQYWLKELEDRVLGLILLVILFPLIICIAVAVKVGSKGPILFRQERYGYNNKKIIVYKFRTMYPAYIDDKEIKQASRNDPRVTPLGKLLRRTSMDELPQLFNVLNGTMSIVGPRPHAVAHNFKYSKVINGYFARHRVKPGMTGWAQVNGFRGETKTTKNMKDRVHHDVYYIENWSLLFDLKILFKTLFVVILNKNVY